jgi:hypothetical protein
MSAINEDSNKPRRLEEETVKYLELLEPKIFDEGLDSNEQEILVGNVFEEIKQRTASAAADRRTNLIIERLCYLSNLEQLMVFIERCAPYAVFLCRNRHSSHVLQALFMHLLAVNNTSVIC